MAQDIPFLDFLPIVQVALFQRLPQEHVIQIMSAQRITDAKVDFHIHAQTDHIGQIPIQQAFLAAI
jgi:hypothetical protein